MPPADIERVGQKLLVVGADVEKNRQCRRGVQAGASGVERQLADRDTHAAGALITKPEDALAVAHHDGLDAVEARIVEDAAHPVLEWKAQEQAARLAEDAAELLTAETDRGRVDDRHQLFDVPRQQRVKQSFIGVLQAAKESIFLQVRAEVAQGGEPASDL